MTGPFTVEAVPAPAVRPVTEIVVEAEGCLLDDQPALPGLEQLDDQSKLKFTEDVSVARYGETYRQRQWRDELLACGIRGKGGQRIEFARLEPLGATSWLQCEGETKGERRERVVVSFGPEHAPLEQRQVEHGPGRGRATQAYPASRCLRHVPVRPRGSQGHRRDQVAGRDAAEGPDEHRPADRGPQEEPLQQRILLADGPARRGTAAGQEGGAQGASTKSRSTASTTTTPRTGAIESGDTTKIAMWMLDTDYDGRSLFPRQVFFPMAGPKDGWARLAKNLKAEIDEDLIEAYRGTVSLPFEPGDFRRAAVKIVDDRGIESLKIIGIA